MTLWLEQLQRKRRLYNKRRTVISEKITWTHRNKQKGSGLTGQEQGGSAQGAEDPLNATASSSTDRADSILQDDAQEITSSSKTGIWSLVNLRKEIRNAVSDIRMQISPTQEKLSPPHSPCVEDAKEEWTILTDDMDSNNMPPVFAAVQSPPPLPPNSSAALAKSGQKTGGKFASTFKFLKAKSRTPSDSKEGGLKKQNSRSGSLSCAKCKQLEDEKFSAQEELKDVEEELQANREIVRLLQKELDVIRVSLETRLESEGKSNEEMDLMLKQRDKHVVELQHSMATLQEEKSLLAQQSKFVENNLTTFRDQVSMLQEMLSAKDETIVQLTHKIFEFESNTHDRGDDGERQHLAPLMPSGIVPDAKELETLKDTVGAYQLQNKFLTKEITELNKLRKYDEQREKEMLMNYANLEALYYQTRSKYLFLLNERHEPVRGDESNKTEEAVTQLLQEALESETEGGADHSRHHFMSSYSMEYDCYGFLVYAKEEETDDILVAKANKLEWQSHQLANRIKDDTEATSRQIKWENFMVGQSGKPLQRSPELKALVRMGVPHAFKEHIWKGCINLHVGATRDKLGPQYYKKDLGERIKNSKFNPAVKQIDLDLLRTLPNNRHFDSMDSDGIPKLRRVLLSYSVHNPLIGYCQGLNRLVAIALLFLSEEDAFWCLEAIIEHLMPKDYYTKTLASAQADQRVLKELVAEKLPKLYAHFEQYDVDLSLYTFNWFLTIFVDNVRPETFLCVWDTLLYEGSKVLFRFALAFLKYAEEEILSFKEAHQIYRFMRALGERITNVKKITHIAFHELNPFPMRAITSKRLHHLLQVREELKELDAIRQDFQSSHSQHSLEGYASEDDLDDVKEDDGFLS
ncbi:TBC1 domain family member 2B-like isoform X2 [Pomacea canaliculata]|nr:TBC1 domain family member 2B-like isoform X2 [Pomacea canaliculata]